MMLATLADFQNIPPRYVATVADFQNDPPRYVAICGAPEVGKSTVAETLAEWWGGKIIDDGRCLREGVKAIYNLRDWHVYTHEGKRSTIVVGGNSYTVRQLLGDLGKLLEAKYGEFFMPE